MKRGLCVQRVNAGEVSQVRQTRVHSSNHTKGRKEEYKGEKVYAPRRTEKEELTVHHKGSISPAVLSVERLTTVVIKISKRNTSKKYNIP